LTGLLGVPTRGPIPLVPYDPAWPVRYEHHRQRISNALGSHLLQIHHIGSTSVPGLSAKPIVDILAVVPDPSVESAFVPALTSLGFHLRVREPSFDEHRMLRTEGKDVHLHVFPPNSAEIRRYLNFRDRLRVNAEDRNRYEGVKQRLAHRDWSDWNDYAEAKSQVIEEIICSGGSIDSAGIRRGAAQDLIVV
jgi:GrpB-like predicted nucleotidyltransferase (UPF0157 family)